MPVRFTGSQAIFTASDTAPSALTQFSYQFWIQPNSITGLNQSCFFGKEFLNPFASYPVGMSANSITLRTLIWSTSGRQFLRDEVLQIGVSYHFVMTYSNGTVRFYLNGKLRQTQNGPVEAIQIGPNHRWRIGTGGPSVDMDDVCAWKNYVLSANEVRELRDRTLTPLDIAQSNHMLFWSLDGNPSANVSISHAGVRTINGDKRNASTLSGSPVYTADPLVYVAPARIKRICTGESGKTLIVEVEGMTGANATVASVSSHPSIRLNGGEETSLASPGPLYESNYLVYPLPFQVQTEDSLTYSCADGWITTSLGDVGSATNEPVDVSTSGIPMLPLQPVTPTTMSMGMNLQPGYYFGVIPVYANRIHQASPQYSAWGGNNPGFTLDKDGNLLTVNAPNALFKIVAASVDSYVTDPATGQDKGAVNMAAGHYRLMWDGTDELRLQGVGDPSRNSVTQISYDRTFGNNNIRVYDVSFPSATYGGYLYMTYGGANVRNIRIWGPEIPSNWTSKFHPEFLRMAGDWSVLRFMVGMATNQSNYTYVSRFLPASYQSYGDVRTVGSPRISTIDPYTANPSNYFMNGRTPFTVTTTTPHGLTTGEVVRFSSFSRAVSCTDGSTVTIPNDHRSHVLVLSPTQFAAQIYTGNVKTPTANQAITGRAFVDLNPAFPLEDIMALSDEVDSDPWICVPHTMPDAEVYKLAEIFAQGLGRTRKLYVEYSNECWNFAPGFLQTEFCHGQARAQGMSPGAWYGKRMAEVHAIFTHAFANYGRPASDIVRVVGSWFADLSWSHQVLAQTRAMGAPIDMVSVAPYFSVTPNAFTAVWDAMDVDQVMDASAMCGRRFGESIMRSHKTVIETYYPGSGVKLVCYEGGMERGVPRGSNVEAMGAKSRAWSRHPRMRDQIMQYLGDMQNYGVELFCYYELNLYAVSPATKGVYTWGVYPAAWNMQDGLGDGSDGKFDNRTGYDLLDRIVSVIGGALRHWALNIPRKQPVNLHTRVKTPRITPAQLRLPGRRRV